MTRWTDEQLKAIDLRGKNLLVAAAAGSGKTAVLIERITRLIREDRVEVDEILVLTFTKAAASEMKERLEKSLENAIETSEDRDFLFRQLEKLPLAQISTIHSFCSSILKRNFAKLELDTDFRMLDEKGDILLKEESLEEVFIKRYQAREQEFHQLLELYGSGRDDSNLRQLVLDLDNFMQSSPDPEGWLRESIEIFNNRRETAETPWLEVISSVIDIKLSEAEKWLESCQRLVSLPRGPITYEEALAGDWIYLQELKEAKKAGLKEFRDILFGRGFMALSRKKDENCLVELKEQFKALRDLFKGNLEYLKKLLPRDMEAMLTEMQSLYPVLKNLESLVQDFRATYQEKKFSQGALDFNDLEHLSLKILADPSAAHSLRKQYKYIFIDEYQDSNLVQETIIQRISRENNVFMVGDVKQSIYRFRLAEPKLFLGKYKGYKDEENAELVLLNKNFRSSRHVVDTVNYLFSQMMSEGLGEIDYDEDACLYYGAGLDEEESPIEFYLLDKKMELEDTEFADLEYMEVEAKAAAALIKEKVGTPFYDHKLGKERPLEWKDFVVLFRTMRNWSDKYVEIFNEEDIPVYGDHPVGYFEALEVNIVLNVLRLIDNKLNDYALLSVLRSPIGSFSEEELALIRINSPKESFHRAFQEYLERTDALGEKVRGFWEQLLSWQKEKQYLPLDQLIWKILSDTGYYQIAGALAGGEQRQGNLRLLMARAYDFCKDSHQSLFAFLNWLDRLQEKETDPGIARLIGENSDVVRIMSIHKSKGLEFPVVIVGGMGKQFNKEEIKKSILFHKELGLGPDFIDLERKAYCSTLAKLAIKEKALREGLSEEMRVLYVAATRAKNQLIFLGGLDNLGDKISSIWLKSKGEMVHGNSYYEWLLPFLIKHEAGHALREYLLDQKEIEDLAVEGKVKVEILDVESLINKQRKASLNKKRRGLEFWQNLKEKEEDEKVRELLLESYGRKDLWYKIPAKLAVTDIPRLAENSLPDFLHREETLLSPRFLADSKKATGVDKGIAYHLVMQNLDLKKVSSINEIEAQLKEMVGKDLLGKEQESMVSSGKIEKFFTSGLGRRILSSSRVDRERPFNLMMPVREIFPERMEEENLLIQGVIDMFFTEGDGLVLVDYKTDYFPEEKREGMLKKYGMQLSLYEKALERITGKKVKDSYLYLFSTDEVIDLGVS